MCLKFALHVYCDMYQFFLNNCQESINNVGSSVRKVRMRTVLSILCVLDKTVTRSIKYALIVG